MRRFDLSLYLVTNGDGMEEEAFFQKVERALRGGVTLVQLREKELGGGAYLARAVRLRELCDRYGVPLIVDDRVDVALAAGAAGVHVGAEDLPVEAARRLLGPDRIVGATAKTVEAARAAIAAGADYLGVGAIYPTETKVKTVLTPVARLAEIRALGTPCVAIGGLCADNLEVLKDSGADGVAVVRALMRSEDPEAEARTLRARVREVLGGAN